VASSATLSTDDRSTRSTPRSRGRRALQYLLIFVSCVLVVDALVGEKGLIVMMKARQEYEALEESLARARADNARLREEARRLREDPVTIEEIARRELGLMKPGERLFILKDVRPTKPERLPRPFPACYIEVSSTGRPARHQDLTRGGAVR
jgi:cell division protein FtsB